MPDDYLEMPADQGGFRFGPLPDVVRVGSDPASADIIVAARVGLPPVAVELHRGAAGRWSLVFPTHPPHPCQLLAQGAHARAGRPVRQGALLQPGETLMVTGSTVHLRLQLVRAGPHGLPSLPEERAPLAALPEPNRAKRAQAEAPRRRWPWSRAQAPEQDAPLVRGIAHETVRRSEATALARIPGAQALQATLRKARQGGLTSPTMIVGVLLAGLSAVLIGGGSLWALLWLLAG